MNMQNADLLKYKIEIYTDNDINYLELAIFFDKPEFLELLPLLRKDYGIDRKTNISNYEKKVNSFQNSKKAKLNLSKYKNAKDLIAYAKNNSTGFEDIEDEMDLYQLLDTEANLICYLFNRPPYFAEPIKQAVLCGVVNDTYFETTSIEVIEHDSVLSTTGSFQLPQVGIVISPTTTDRTMRTLFRQAQGLFKTDSRVSYYKPRIDVRGSIRKYRRWYWQRVENIKLKEMADTHERGNRPKSEKDESYISTMVNSYKRLLNL